MLLTSIFLQSAAVPGKPVAAAGFEAGTPGADLTSAPASATTPPIETAGALPAAQWLGSEPQPRLALAAVAAAIADGEASPGPVAGSPEELAAEPASGNDPYSFRLFREQASDIRWRFAGAAAGISIGGFSGEHGFSYEDLVVDAAGALFSVVRHSVPGLRDKVDFRLLYVPSRAAGMRSPASRSRIVTRMEQRCGAHLPITPTSVTWWR